MPATDFLKAIQDKNVSFFETTTIDVTTKSEKGNPWLYVATQYQRPEIVKQLLKQGADANATNTQGFTALHLAASENYIEIARILLDAEAHIEAKSGKNRSGWTPLHLAASRGHADIICLLLEKGASINAKNKNYVTPLMKAAQSGRAKATQLLLENKAPLNQRDHDRKTALAHAMFQGDPKVVDLLLTYGESPWVEVRKLSLFLDYWERLPLWRIALEQGHVSLVKLLLERKLLNVNQKDANGNTPLFYANDLPTLKVLLDHRADVNAQDERGNTCLHITAGDDEWQRPELVAYLLSRGADVYLKNSEDETPLALLLFSIFINHLDENFNTQISRAKKDMLLMLLNHGSAVRNLRGSDHAEAMEEWDAHKIDLSPDFIHYFFKHGLNFPDSVQRHKIFIRFLLSGFEIGYSDNTTEIEDIMGIIQEENPDATFDVDPHPVLKAWNHIKTTVTALLSEINIPCTEEEIPDVLYFVFCVYQNPSKHSLHEKNSLEYFYAQPVYADLKDENKEKFHPPNPLYWFANQRVKLPPELKCIIIEKILDTELEQYSEYLDFSKSMLRRLCIQLSNPLSPLNRFVKEGPQHDWSEGPLLLGTADASVTLSSVSP